MKPYEHAKNSARKFGGKAEDYLKIHDWFDQTKSAHADMRHRAILHNAMGCYVAEQVFGHNIDVQLDSGEMKKVSVRDVAEQHIIEDMGRIPSLTDYLEGMPFYNWLGGPTRKKRLIPMREEEEFQNTD